MRSHFWRWESCDGAIKDLTADNLSDHEREKKIKAVTEVRQLTSTWTSLQDSKCRVWLLCVEMRNGKGTDESSCTSVCLGKFRTRQITTAKELVSVSIWQPTPVFLPGESQGWGSLVGCHLRGRTESDTTEAT